MSKNKDDLDMDLDSLGLDEFEEPPVSKDKSRNPVMQAAHHAKKSALNAVWGRGKRTKVILDGMPPVAEAAHDGYRKSADVVGALLSHTKDEVAKTEKLVKTQTRQLMPTLRKYLPDSLTRRVGNWAKSDGDGYSNYDPVQAAIDRMNDEVFNRQGTRQTGDSSEEQAEATRRQKEVAEGKAEEKVRSAIESMRMDELLRITSGISRDVRSQSELASGVLLQAQRRGLELQYRQLFALQDLIKIQQASLDRNAPNLEAIVKNTALPDYAKENFGEIHSAQFKRKVSSWINPAQYAEGFLESIREKGIKKISDIGNELRSGLGLLMEGAVEDDFDLDDQSGLSPDGQKTNLRNKAMELGSGWLAKKLLGPHIEKLQKRSREYLSNKPGAMNALNKGAYTFNNLSSISNSALAGERDDALGGVFNFLRSIGIVDPYRREQVALGTRDQDALSKASKFDHRTWLTINEVLPAWFGRLNRSILSLGGKDVDETYDITTRGFIENKTLANRIRKGVANDRQRLRLQDTVNETVSFLDKDKSLSKEERVKLGSFIEQRAAMGREFNVEHLLKDPTTLQQAMGFSGGQKVADLLRKHSNAEAGGTYRLSNEMARRIGDIQSYIRSRQTGIDEAAFIYGEKALRDAGLFHYNSKDDTFGADRDISDPYTLFNSLEVGKTRVGRSRDRQQEIARKLANGSALAPWLAKHYNLDGTQIENIAPSDSAHDGRRGMFGFGKGKGSRPVKYSGMSRDDLKTVLYGAQKTNFVELLQPLREFSNVANPTGTRGLEEAIRSNSHHDVLQSILTHVKSIDEKGIRFAAGDEVEGGELGTEGKKKRKGITATSLFGQWGQLLGNTISGAWGLAGKGFSALNAKRKGVTSWLRGKFTGGEGPGLFSRMGNVLGAGWDGARAFATRSFGNKESKPGQGKLREWLHAIGGWGGDVVNGTVGKINSGRKWLGAQGSEKMGMVKDWMTSYPDIYVKGETNPRIKGRLLKAGNYFVNGKLIYSPKEITGAVLDAQGVEIIGADEITNPEFKLVDSWGRPIGTPLGRIGSRIGKGIKFVAGLPGKTLELGKSAFERIAGYAKDNPLTRWWNRDRSKQGGGWFNFNFGSKARKSTDHILIRIYKLLNARMSGDAEDEAWTEEFERNTGGGAAGAAARRRARRIAKLAKDKMSSRWQGYRERGAEWGNRAKNKFNLGWGWLTRKGATARRNANEMVDPFRGSAVDIGTRYEALKSLYGREDDVAQFYRDKINRRGGISKAKVWTAAEGAAQDGVNAVKGKAKSAWELMNEKLGKMVNLQEMSWFNTMRSSSEEAGASSGFISSLYGKWAKRNPMKEDSERKDYFQFFRRKKSGEKGPPRKGFLGALGAGFSKAGDLVSGLVSGLGMFGSLLGGIAKPLISILGFAAKWGIVKPAVFAGRMALGAAGGILGTVGGLAATAGTALVTAVGWPVIMGVAAAGGLIYTGYKLSQRKPAMFLDKMRLAQYGFRDYDLWSSDDGAKAMYLEDNLKGFVTFDEADNATMRSLNAKDVDALTKGFGIEEGNRTETMAFHAFMIQRFIPVYLNWLTAVRQVTNNVALGEVGRADKVSRDDMLKIYGKVRLDKDSTILRAVQDPRKADQGFFSKLWDTVTFTPPDLLPPEEVMEVQKEVEGEIKARKDVQGRSKDSVYFKTHSTEVKEVQRGVAESMNMLAGIDKERYDNEIPDGTTRVVEAITVQVDVDTAPAKKDLDAMQSVRMKSYGLTNLQPAQVQSLLDLERKVVPMLNLKTSTFEGNWQEVMEAFIPGCTKTENSKARAQRWFEGRFLPVLMTYVMGVKRYVPTGDPLKLAMTGGYLYEVALMVSKAYSYRNDFRQSIWSVSINPFGDNANDDPRSIEPELETLKALSKEADMAVRNMLKENKGKETIKRAKWRDVKIDKQAEAFDKQSANTNDYSGAAANNDRYRQQVGGMQSSDPSGGGSTAIAQAGGFRNYVNSSLGLSTIELGAGGEGDYRSLASKYPIESLNDPRVVQQLVADAAKIVGVPPGVALSMAFAESKFDYRATARDAKGRPGAKGIFQFLDSTWSGSGGNPGELQNWGNKYGVPKGSTAYDPYANALLGVNFIRNNIQRAEKDYGGKVPQGVAYLYHFMGAGGGSQFMKALKANPNELAIRVPFKNAQSIFKANQSVFYDKGRPRTLAEVMGELNRRMGGAVGALSTTPGLSQNKDLFKGLNGSEPVDLGPVPKATEQPSPSAANDASIAANDSGGPAAASTPPPGSVPGANGTSSGGSAGSDSPVLDKTPPPMPTTPVETRRIPDPADIAPTKPGTPSPVGAGFGDLLDVGEEQTDLLGKIYQVLSTIAKNGSMVQHAPAQAPTPMRMPQPPISQPTPTLDVRRKAS